MKIERQAAMVKSVAKNMKTKERKEAKKEKMYSEFYTIARKIGKSLDEMKKEDLTNKEYKFIIEFIETILDCSTTFYPNLH